MELDLPNLIDNLRKESQPKSSKKRKHESLFDNLSNKQRNDIIYSELKILALEKVLTFLEDFTGKKNKKNMRARQVGVYLQNLISMFEAQLQILKLSDDDPFYKSMIGKKLNEPVNKLSSMALSLIMIDILNDLKLQNYTNGKNLSDYIRNQIEDESLKFLKIMIPNKKIKIKEVRSDPDYEPESDFEDSENEDYEITSIVRKDKSKDLVIDLDEEEYDEEEYDEEEYDEEEYDEEEYDEEEYDEEEESQSENLNKIIKSSKEGKLINKNFMEELNKGKDMNKNPVEDTLEYFCKLEEEKRVKYLDKLKKINMIDDMLEPSIIKVMNMDISDKSKKYIINQLNTLSRSRGDNSKLKTWVENVLKLPLGVNVGINISELNSPKKVKKFISKLNKQMNSAVFGHSEAKRKIVQLMAQSISNPSGKGGVLGIWGPPGNGKTSLIKEGIAKAMQRPFIFISLGGAQDASFLEGHGYTYEGSIYGRIAQGLINCKCNNPIIYFDELDKISKTPRGDEIVNLLVHMIDPIQNCHFMDKYFHGIEIDLSKCTFIFSFNEPRKVNHILMDRITKVQTKYLTLSQKIHVAQDYLLNSILDEIGLKKNSVIIKNNVIEYIVNKYTFEGGVRGLKKILFHIIRELNVVYLTNSKFGNKVVTFPFTITLKMVDEHLKEFRPIEEQMINKKSKVGVINGMWAGSLGVGGILPIETIFIPSKNTLSIKATGSLEKVIKESTEVAGSLAWSKLSDKEKEEWNEKWVKNPEGFHIHCPDGASPKDGPSAGTALTVALYSLLKNKPIRNDIAITGEINLQGEVLVIGGLEEKLQGAKRAGVKLAIIPKSNLVDMKKIRQRVPNLEDNKFKVVCAEKFDDVLKHVF